MAQTVKRLSTMQETWVQSLGREDPLEKEMAIHSSTIARKIPWTEEPGRLLSDFTSYIILMFIYCFIFIFANGFLLAVHFIFILD